MMTISRYAGMKWAHRYMGSALTKSKRSGYIANWREWMNHKESCNG